MTRHLQQEIRQTKPFGTIEEEVYLQILRTAQVSQRWGAEALKPLGITPAQLNVLRILRGARPQALSSRVLGERMIHRDPDLTRMLDRLEAAGLIAKERNIDDRRVINVTVTEAGAKLAETGTETIRSVLSARFGPLGAKKLEQLADLLDAARHAAEPAATEETTS